MTQARGYKSKLLLDFEETFGEDPTTPAGVLLPVNSCGVAGSRAKNTAQTLTGTRNPPVPFDGNESVSGPLVVPLDSVAMWYWLKAMFGAPSTGGTGPYVHSFTVQDAMPSLVLEKQFGTATPSYAKHNGCKIASCSLSFGGDGELVANLNVEGASEALGTTAYQAAATAIAMQRLNNFQAAIQLGGASVGNVREVSLDIDFGLDTEQYTIGGGGTRGDIPEGIMSITGRVRALFEDLTLLNLAVNSTESSLEINVNGGTSSQLDIIIPELQFERNTPGIEGPKGILVDLPFVAYYHDDSAASAIQFDLTNTDAHA